MSTERTYLRGRPRVRLGPPVSLPVDVRKHASRARGQKAPVGNLEQAVDDVADESLRPAIHRDGQYRATTGARPDLHAPRAPGLRCARLLDRGGDHPLLPLVSLDRPDAEARPSFPHPRPVVA